MDPADIASAAESLRVLLAAIDSGEIEATEVERAHLSGSLDTLDALVERTD